MIEGSLCPPLSQSECDDAPSLRLKRGGGSDAGVILILPRLPADLIIPDISLLLSFVLSVVASERVNIEPSARLPAAFICFIII